MPDAQSTNTTGSTRERALWWAAKRHGGESAVRRWHPSPGSVEVVDEHWHKIIDDDLGRTHRDTASRYDRRRKLALADEHRMLLGRLSDNWRVLLGLSGKAVEDLAVRLGLEMVAVSVRVAGKDKALKAMLGVIEGREADLLVTRVEELKDLPPAKLLGEQWPRHITQLAQRMRGIKLLRTLGLTQLTSLMHAQMNPAQQAVAARHCRSELIAVLGSAAPAAGMSGGEAEAFEPVLKELLGQVSGGRR